MESMDSIIGGYIEAAAKRPVKVEDGDYEKDGLLYCGKCHTPKQKVIEVGGWRKTVPVMCKCEDARYKAEEEARRKQKEWESVERARTSGIQDKKMLAMRFDADDQQSPELSKMMHRYVDHWQEMKDENQGLILCGDVGCGKTFFAGCIANALIEKHVPVLCTDFVKILAAMQFCEDRNTYLNGLDRYHLLIIDDLGAERQSDYALETVFAVINGRVKSGRPMILTTNLSVGELKNLADLRYKRIYDRILEMCLPIAVKGVSRRGKIGADKAERAKKILFGGLRNERKD